MLDHLLDRKFRSPSYYPTKSDLLIKQLFEFGHFLVDFGLQFTDIGDDFGGGGVLDGDVDSFFVFVDGEVVIVFRDFVFGDKEALVGALAVGFSGEVAEAGDDIGDIVGFDGAALVVEREAICLHIVEPDLIGTAV